MNLAQARQKHFQKLRNKEQVKKENILEQLTTEGYEDFEMGYELNPPYQGKELEAYMLGWNNAKSDNEIEI